MRNTGRVFTASLKRIIILLTLSLLLVSGPDLVTSAQINIGGLGDKIIKNNPLSKLLGGKAPITTSIKDAKFGDPSLDSKDLPAPQPITMLKRTADGGFILKPGLYEMRAQSYCLHAGTYGPGGGDGYSYAPVEGPAKDAVISIVRNSYKHPEIQQRQIQQLLWAVVSRAKFEDLTPELRAVASQLLTLKQLATLNRSALDIISGPALQRALGQMPPGVRQVMESEARLRQMLTTPGATFAEMERIAVLAGDAPMGEGSRQVPAGRWSRHPDGYYVRYMPQGYSLTLTQVWVPEVTAANYGARTGGRFSSSFIPYGADSAVGKELKPSEHIAVPGNTARQRLLQSPRGPCTNCDIEKVKKVLAGKIVIKGLYENAGQNPARTFADVQESILRQARQNAGFQGTSRFDVSGGIRVQYKNCSKRGYGGVQPLDRGCELDLVPECKKSECDILNNMCDGHEQGHINDLNAAFDLYKKGGWTEERWNDYLGGTSPNPADVRRQINNEIEQYTRDIDLLTNWLKNATPCP